MGNSQGQQEKARRHTVAGSNPQTATNTTKTLHTHFIVKLAKELVTKTIEEDNIDGISEAVFQRHLFANNSILAKKLFLHLGQQNEGDGVISKQRFIESTEALLQFIRVEQFTELYVKIFAEGANKISEESLSCLISEAFSVSGLENSTETDLQYLVASILHKKQEVTVMWVQTWIQKNAANLLVNLHEFVMSRISSGSKDTYSCTLKVPEIETHVRIDAVTRWYLTSSLPNLYIRSQTDTRGATNSQQAILQMMKSSDPVHWHLLYDSNSDGLSMTRLKNEVLTYRGPTLMFLSSDIGHTYCIASDVEWKESHQYRGCEECRLLHLHPNFHIVEAGAKMIYFNLSFRGYPLGLHVGVDFRKPSIKIDHTLNVLEYKAIPSKLTEIRVFGCGQLHVKEAQERQKKWEHQQAEKNKQVNLSVDWSENPDRYLLELGSSTQSYTHYMS